MRTCAVHLEIGQDLSTKEFMMCLKRFVAQHVRPTEIISANVSHFNHAHKVVDMFQKKSDKVSWCLKTCPGQGINGMLIVELASGMGFVRIVNRSLWKAIGRKLLCEIQSANFLRESEANVNNCELGTFHLWERRHKFQVPGILCYWKMIHLQQIGI